MSNKAEGMDERRATDSPCRKHTRGMHYKKGSLDLIMGYRRASRAMEAKRLLKNAAEAFYQHYSVGRLEGCSLAQEVRALLLLRPEDENWICDSTYSIWSGCRDTVIPMKVSIVGESQKNMPKLRETCLARIPVTRPAQHSTECHSVKSIQVSQEGFYQALKDIRVNTQMKWTRVSVLGMPIPQSTNEKPLSLAVKSKKKTCIIDFRFCGNKKGVELRSYRLGIAMLRPLFFLISTRAKEIRKEENGDWLSRMMMWTHEYVFEKLPDDALPGDNKV
ncbi:uncharacterized protein RSE6_03172 [Rhynchosporium secalis]|uniref:Uncharacterized protein n=1 Tax=Rhynchosporium secalis TaxID=38038 RepID=A0A1E1M3K4_RHYSE|nr:uncharacterized protein RSE6_03172 [Rhynchosporium secalis]